MILNARNKKPKISFGLGVTDLSINDGNVVKVWLENIFSEKEFQFSLVGVDAVAITPYEWEISNLIKGNSYSIEMEILPKETKPEEPEPGPKPKAKPIPKPTALKSNSITLTVL